MKKFLIMSLFCLFITSSLFAMSPRPPRGNDNGPGHHHRPGGGGTPEPASILLLLAGGAVAYGIKKIIKKK